MQVRSRFGFGARGSPLRGPLVVETWRCTFGGSLVRSARFGDLAPHFFLEEVSYETLVLETWRFTFGGGLVRNGFGAGLRRGLCSPNVVYGKELSATGERETCWCKRSVSLVSGMIGGIV